MSGGEIQKRHQTEIINYVERIFDNLQEFDAREVFMAAVDVEELMRSIRQRTEVEASKFIPTALEALREAAASGNVSALKLLFDVVGITGSKAGKSTEVSVNNQILVLPEERESIRQAYLEAIADGCDGDDC